MPKRPSEGSLTALGGTSIVILELVAGSARSFLCFLACESMALRIVSSSALDESASHAFRRFVTEVQRDCGW